MPSLNTKLASAPNTQTNYVLKATSSTTIGNSLIQDNGTTITLGGALSGTSATFSSNITATDAVLTKNGDITIKFNPNNVAKWDLYYNNADGTIGFYDRVGSAFRMTLAQTGAATFSSTSGIGLTIQADWNRSLTNDSQLYIKGATNGNKQLRIGYDTTGNVGYIQALTSGTSVDNLLLNPSGGNVGIGTSSPSTILHVVDTSANDTTLTLGTTNEIPTIKAGGSNTDLRLEAIGSGGNLYFTTNGNLRTTITSGGALALGTSNSNGFTFRISSNANNNSDAKKVMQLGNDVVNSVSAYMYIGSYAGIDWLVGKDTSSAGDYRFNLSLYTGEQRMVLYTNGNYSFAGSNVSDIRLKSNINTLDVNALDKITHFVPKSYYMTDNPEQIRYGFIAQEIGELVPDLVTGEEKEQEYLGLDYNGVLTLAVKAIQELNQKVEAQQEQINQLINK